MNKVTVIIPVYNALEFLKECVDSIYKSADASLFELLIINDCSPDVNIKLFLDNLKHSNLKVLHNEKNLGFVGNCNKAMKLAAPNDVILLNSDTEVTPGWIEKLQQAAYSSKKIATVTPLSNNAVIASVPIPFQDNDIPDGYDKDLMNRTIERLSPRSYPEVPTGVGYCMYVRRDALEDLGLFDEVLFAKGYGEENEFCQRAIEHGWINILDDSTFIYHKGHASFTSEKAEPKENMQKLLSKYPNYMIDAARYASNNPLRGFTSTLRILFQLKVGLKGTKTILVLKHLDIGAGGGTTKHVHALAEQGEYNYVILYPSPDQEVIMEIHQGGKLWKLRRIRIKITDTKRIKQLLELLGEALEIRTIHVHHLLGWGSETLASVLDLKEYTILSFHDLYLTNASPAFFMDPSTKNLTVSSAKYKAKMKELFERVDLRIAPSKYVAEHFTREFDLEKEIEVIPHGIKLPKRRLRFSNFKNNLNIAFLGIPVRSKGIDIFMQLIKEHKNQFNFFIVGTKQHDFYDYLKEFDLKEYVDFQIFPYEDGDPQRILQEHKIDLIILPSKVPESFSYALSESWQSGIPVVAFDIGAIGERIEDSKAGWAVTDINEMGILLQSLDKDRNAIKEKYDKVAQLKVMTLEQMLARYQDIYAQAALQVDSSNEPKRLDYTVMNDIVEVTSPEQGAIVYSTMDKLKRQIIGLPYVGKLIYKTYLSLRK